MQKALEFMLYLINDEGYEYPDAHTITLRKFNVKADELAALYDNL